MGGFLGRIRPKTTNNSASLVHTTSTKLGGRKRPINDRSTYCSTGAGCVFSKQEQSFLRGGGGFLGRAVLDGNVIYTVAPLCACPIAHVPTHAPTGKTTYPRSGKTTGRNLAKRPMLNRNLSKHALYPMLKQSPRVTNHIPEPAASPHHSTRLRDTIRSSTRSGLQALQARLTHVVPTKPGRYGPGRLALHATAHAATLLCPPVLDIS